MMTPVPAALRACPVVAAVCVSAAAMGQHATPTTGPAERAGRALDRAWSSVSIDVSEALLASRIRLRLQ